MHSVSELYIFDVCIIIITTTIIITIYSMHFLITLRRCSRKI